MSVGTSTSPILDNLPHQSYWSRLPPNFMRIFFVIVRPVDYIQGKNEYSKKIKLTAPVITKVSPSYEPFRPRREPSRPATGERPSVPENEQCIHRLEAVQRVGTGLQRR